jgi:hypothetical protein
MGRVIRTKSGAAERRSLLKSVGSALVALSVDNVDDAERLDLIAFIAGQLPKVWELVEETTGAWEKRDFWVKAEKFRQQWTWVVAAIARLDSALEDQSEGLDDAGLQDLIEPILDKVGPVAPASDRPWVGGYSRWRRERGQGPN